MGLYVPPIQQTLDANGSAISGAKLFFYLTGTTTPAPSYADDARTTPLANPVVADSAGRFPAIYLDPAITYRVVIADADGTAIRTVDPYTPSGNGSFELPIESTEVKYRGPLLRVRLDEEFDLHLARQSNDDDDRNALAETQDDGRLNIRLRAGKGIDDSQQGTFLLGAAPYAAGQEADQVQIAGNIHRDNTRIIGDGAVRLDQNGYGFLFNLNSLSPDPEDNVKGFELSGCVLEGGILRDDFYEFAPIVGLSGASDFLIHHNKFIGARGDDIWCMSSPANGVERHNQRGKIVFNYFDGLTKDNRCALAIVDGEDIDFMFNYVTRHTQPGGIMTGPVDIEPELNSFHVCRRIRVNHNTFIDNNGSPLALLLKNPAFFDVPCKDFQFNHNVIDGAVGMIDLFGLGDATTILTSVERFGLQVIGNQVKNVSRIARLIGWYGMDFAHNDLEDSDRIELGSDIYNFPTRDAYIRDNTFSRTGKVTGPTILQRARTVGVEIKRNRFNDCGLPGQPDGAPVGAIYHAQIGDVDVRLDDNTVINSAGIGEGQGKLARFAQVDGTAGAVSATSSKLNNRIIGETMAPDTFNPASILGVAGSTTFGAAASIAPNTSAKFDVTVPGAIKEATYKVNVGGAYSPGADDVFFAHAYWRFTGTVRVVIENRPIGGTYLDLPAGTVLTVTQDN